MFSLPVTPLSMSSDILIPSKLRQESSTSLYGPIFALRGALKSLETLIAIFELEGYLGGRREYQWKN